MTAQVNQTTSPPAAAGRQAWGAVLALSLAAFALVASEFLPVSLLTPIAADLHMTEGQAGQAISISGAFALLTSLFISSLAGSLDRKKLLLGLAMLMILAGTVVALAPNYGIFMGGRALIGVAIGGFWSMSAATAIRLVPEHHVSRALAIMNGGNALASVLAAPLGSFLGAIVGWRWAFFCVVPVAAIPFIWKLVALPSLKTEPAPGSVNIFKLLKRPSVALGMSAAGLFFMGQFTLFTYLRPSRDGDPRQCLHAFAPAPRPRCGRLHRHDLDRRAPQGRPLSDAGHHPSRDGTHRRCAHRVRKFVARDRRPAGPLGADRHGGTCRLVDLAREDTATGCGGRGAA